MLITRYNLSGRPKSTVDLHQMIFDMSPKNLFLLEAEKGKLPRVNTYPNLSEDVIAQGMVQKREAFNWEQAQLSWKSWNAADARNK